MLIEKDSINEGSTSFAEGKVAGSRRLMPLSYLLYSNPLSLSTTPSA
jgi:hypothetical protein